MEVGFTVYDNEGRMHQAIFELPNVSTIPNVGDGLIFDGIICSIEKRDFQIESKDKVYGWSITAREQSNDT